jgi:hypothetical protein
MFQSVSQADGSGRLLLQASSVPLSKTTTRSRSTSCLTKRRITRHRRRGLLHLNQSPSLLDPRCRFPSPTNSPSSTSLRSTHLPVLSPHSSHPLPPLSTRHLETPPYLLLRRRMQHQHSRQADTNVRHLRQTLPRSRMWCRWRQSKARLSQRMDCTCQRGIQRHA